MGSNDATFSKSFKYLVNTHSSAQSPTSYLLIDAQSGRQLKEIANNRELLDKHSGYLVSDMEFSTLKTKNGEFNMYMIKPVNFDPEKTYPTPYVSVFGPGLAERCESLETDQEA